jgi:hypothetical protein
LEETYLGRVLKLSPHAPAFSFPAVTLPSPLHLLSLQVQDKDADTVDTPTSSFSSISVLTIEKYHHWIALWNTTLVFVSLCLAVASHEDYLRTRNDPNYKESELNLIKVLQTFITLVLILGAAAYQLLHLWIQNMRTARHLPRRAYLKCAMTFCVEFFVLLWHPSEFINGQREMAIIVTSNPDNHHYSWETVLTWLVMLRIYMVGRGFRHYMMMQHCDTTHVAIVQADIKIDSTFFWIKFCLDRHVAVFAAVLSVIFILWTSYLVRLAESGGTEDRFFWYTDCLWFVMVTATTTGYGDLSPETLLGRTVAVLVMICGIIMASLATAVLSDHLDFNPEESRFVEATHTFVLESGMRQLSARVIQAFFRYNVAIKEAEAWPGEIRKDARFQARRKLDKACRRANAQRKKNLREQNESRLVTKAVVEDIHQTITVDLTRLILDLDHKVSQIKVVMERNGLEFPTKEEEEEMNAQKSPVNNPY